MKFRITWSTPSGKIGWTDIDDCASVDDAAEHFCSTRGADIPGDAEISAVTNMDKRWTVRSDLPTIESSEIAVDAEFGYSAWQEFCNTYEINDVDPDFWDICVAGPSHPHYEEACFEVERQWKGYNNGNTQFARQVTWTKPFKIAYGEIRIYEIPIDCDERDLYSGCDDEY